MHSKKTLYDKLIESGISFLSDHAIKELSVRKIAGLCGVSPHAAYNYFKNKKEYINALTNSIIEEFTGTYLAESSGSKNTSDDVLPAQLYMFLAISQKYPFIIGLPETAFAAQAYDNRQQSQPDFTGSPAPITASNVPALLALLPKEDYALQSSCLSGNIIQIILYAFYYGSLCLMHDGILSETENLRNTELLKQLKLLLQLMAL
ncbi:MAG: TetR/AcrR family transcriptional regulator [Christensenella sp.]|nr:TetR/AcrR family transcriptional regulator [Christensenella sp.]